LTRKIVTAWGSVIDTAAAATVIRPVADRVQLVTIRNRRPRQISRPNPGIRIPVWTVDGDAASPPTARLPPVRSDHCIDEIPADPTGFVDGLVFASHRRSSQW
jgi:hypothetical protein